MLRDAIDKLGELEAQPPRPKARRRSPRRRHIQPADRGADYRLLGLRAVILGLPLVVLRPMRRLL
ncbi:hypothetical protein [Stutzerimonas xanthomarina]|uniref:hypothetical protein n=1 Tax=Stutzerimonas xanthomarina TaxID=271420 RepID=UPI003AA7E2A4